MIITLFLGFFGLFSSEPIYEKISNKIQKDYQTEILCPRGLTITAVGGSSQKGIKMIHLGVATNGPGSIDQARTLMVFLFQELLNRYNTNPSIRPYLLNYPFTEKNIEFSIRFVDSKGICCRKDVTKKDEDQIAYVTCFNGRIKYMVDDYGGLNPYRGILFEDYQDALRIVQNQSPNLAPQPSERE
ncbi:hypothetical protein [Estrella lausannensis]|uniref:Uncharacterized protein n=1 Tax=Estrella lausannensis TaxID=483423 RepID=A0A0H5E3A9_9BACT|nr:hypothetical protein [Estrella lausannensis]CRX37705.1 hypothetical protein ELAC_0344 [Estrella lausannensis]